MTPPLPVFSICLLFVFGAGSVAAQSAAEEIETLLAAQAVTYAQAARFVLDAAEAAAFDSPAQAFAFALQRNWLPAGASPDTPARLDGVSLLLMRSFDLRGGILFTITGGPPLRLPGNGIFRLYSRQGQPRRKRKRGNSAVFDRQSS